MRESSQLVGSYVCEISFVGGNLKCTLDFSDVSFQPAVLRHFDFLFCENKLLVDLELEMSSKYLIFLNKNLILSIIAYFSSSHEFI